MGYSITWCAVKESEAQDLLDYLGMSQTGEVEEFPESPLSTAKLDTGWRVIWCNEYACPSLKSEVLEAISSEHDILLCLVEEHVMASSAELWSGGNRVWWISHEGENGPKGLDTDGTLPDVFPEIKSKMEEAQLSEGGEEADVDFLFEIPLKVAESLVGFKHDEEYTHVSGNQFLILKPPVPNKGFFARLLSR